MLCRLPHSLGLKPCAVHLGSAVSMAFARRSSPEQGLCSIGCSDRCCWGGAAAARPPPGPSFGAQGALRPASAVPGDLRVLRRDPAERRSSHSVPRGQGSKCLPLPAAEASLSGSATWPSQEIKPWGRRVKSHHQVPSECLRLESPRRGQLLPAGARRGLGAPPAPWKGQGKLFLPAHSNPSTSYAHEDAALDLLQWAGTGRCARSGGSVGP